VLRRLFVFELGARDGRAKERTPRVLRPDYQSPQSILVGQAETLHIHSDRITPSLPWCRRLSCLSLHQQASLRVRPIPFGILSLL